ncbi:MAG: DUF6788 family protein [Candidatus Thermoplasmatota archaeon]
MRKSTQTSLAHARRLQRRLVARLTALGPILHGSLVARYRPCGRDNCRCARPGDPGHGPAYCFMLRQADGKLDQVYVRKEDKERVETAIENYRRAREVIEEISTIHRQLLREGALFNSKQARRDGRGGRVTTCSTRTARSSSRSSAGCSSGRSTRKRAGAGDNRR